MITGEIIKQQEIDTPFTDSQIALIEKLSKNDEDAVIYNKTKTWYTEWDTLIGEQSGLTKEQGEKASDYAKRAFAALKSEKNDYSTALSLYKDKATTLETEIATLKDGKIDAATTQKIHDLKAELSSLKDAHQKQLQEKDQILTEKEKTLIGERVKSEINAATSGMTFKKDDTTTALKGMAIQAATNELLAEATMEMVEGKTQWRDKNGEIIRNPKNGNEPATTADLLAPKLTAIIDVGRKADGTGVKGANGNVTLTGDFAPTAKTRTDFDRQASEYLVAKGNERTNPDFAVKLSELRKEFRVSELPEA